MMMRALAHSPDRVCFGMPYFPSGPGNSGLAYMWIVSVLNGVALTLPCQILTVAGIFSSEMSAFWSSLKMTHKSFERL